jgi:hypothetical protein
MTNRKNSAVVVSYTEPRKIRRARVAPEGCRTIKPTTADQIESKFVERVELLDNECWLWHGQMKSSAKPEKGTKPVPVFSAATSTTTRKLFTAHRYAYEKRIGRLPDQKVAALQNTCGLVRCVNPHHYELLTRQTILLKAATPTRAKIRRSATKCEKGLHDRDPENPYRTKSGKRVPCQPCTQEIQRAMYQRKKERKALPELPK